MDIKVEGSALQALIEKATLDALGEAGREVLAKEVVRYLTTSEGSSYGRGKSPLFEALHRASERVAAKVIEDKLANDPEFLAQIDSLYTEAFKKFNDAETREKLVARMADRLSGAFAERY